MKLRKLLSMFSLMLVLCSCTDTPNLSLFTNEYETFETFKAHLTQLNSTRNEGELYVFQPNISNVASQEYKVIGVDYAHKNGHKDGKICDGLYYREAFCLIKMPNENDTFVVSFSLKTKYLDNLEWVKEDDSRYNYSTQYLGSESLQYVLTDHQENNNLVWIKFNSGISKTSIASILDSIKFDFMEAK